MGYLGVDANGKRLQAKYNGSKRNTREYEVWNNMMKRCYSPTSHIHNPSYVGTSVCERWHCYANFLEDLPLIEGYELWRDNPNQRIALDKDVKGNGLKLYSLDTCCFLSQSENSSDAGKRNGNPVQGRNLKTGELTPIYLSANQASREFGCNVKTIHRILKGETKSFKDFTWFYV